MTYPVKHVSISINKSRDEVYRHVANPELFTEWLSFVKSVAKKSTDTWVAQTDIGELIFVMSPVNDFGVLDHLVTQSDGSRIKNTLRVIDNGDGCEVIFTLLHLPGRSIEEFKTDAQAIRQDLERLKKLLEQ